MLIDIAIKHQEQTLCKTTNWIKSRYRENRAAIMMVASIINTKLLAN